MRTPMTLRTTFAAIASSAFALIAAPLAAAAEITWVCSTADKPWQAMPAPPVVADANVVPDVAAHVDRPQQRIDGFGGCFNELGWQALGTLPEAKRDEVMRSLFADDGCAFTLGRIPIGASDFALDGYSLDD